MIAGHTFDGPWGRCSCGQRFSDISGATHKELHGPLGWAHSGTLIERELNEIQAEVKRLWTALEGVADGSSGSQVAAALRELLL